MSTTLPSPENVAISFQPITGEIQFLTGGKPPLAEPVLIDPLRGNVYRIFHAECPAWAMGGLVFPPLPIPNCIIVGLFPIRSASFLEIHLEMNTIITMGSIRLTK